MRHRTVRGSLALPTLLLSRRQINAVAPAAHLVGWELPWKQITLDKPSEFGRDRFAFVARFCSEFLACKTLALGKEPARIIRKQGCAAGRHDGSRLSVPKRLHAPCLAWQMRAFAQTRN
ncbi:hypothetical protein [Bradyrhizobium sp. Ash2021]|uniref:hypothetical protein n=1 Tax=Bradyrhizobium sp. Ash2021 TaxID=2954771 RepID=UPI0028159CB3|nr:hypothetical protein [Bradyrhizobium sp. Ash2021]WMT73881.1 hypothetical protein NL528_39190 [Bradyrhizobium sp. Ash2021]